MTQSQTIILTVGNRENQFYYFSTTIFKLPFAEFVWAHHSLRNIPSSTKKFVRHLQNRPGSIASDYRESIYSLARYFLPVLAMLEEIE